jgi:hypothetical protein
LAPFAEPADYSPGRVYTCGRKPSRIAFSALVALPKVIPGEPATGKVLRKSNRDIRAESFLELIIQSSQSSQSSSCAGRKLFL